MFQCQGLEIEDEERVRRDQLHTGERVERQQLLDELEWLVLSPLGISLWGREARRGLGSGSGGGLGVKVF